MNNKKWLSRRRLYFSVAPGFTLIELMVAMVIGLALVGAGLAMYVSSGQASRGGRAISQMTEDASIMFGLMRLHIAMAGYGSPTGEVGEGNVLTTGFTGRNAISGCSGWPLQDGKRGCRNEDDADLSDYIEVSYEADGHNTVATKNPEKPTDCAGSGIEPNESGGGTIAENKFYVQDNSLTCDGSGGGGPQPLIGNVVKIKFRYGVATEGNPGVATHYKTAKEIGDASSVEWGRVVSVNICMVLRSEVPVLDEGLGKYYDCHAETSTDQPADYSRHLYRAFYTTVSLQNRI